MRWMLFGVMFGTGAMLCVTLETRCVAVAGEPALGIVLDGEDTGAVFHGIGVASGGGAVARLLK